MNHGGCAAGAEADRHGFSETKDFAPFASFAPSRETPFLPASDPQGAAPGPACAQAAASSIRPVATASASF